MKKFLTLFVAALMLVSAFSMNVFAAHDAGGDNGSADLSETSITGTVTNGSSSDINLKVGTIGNRYAVDVTFPDMTFSIGDIVWDVNNHKYVSAGTSEVKDVTYDITVTNHSDKTIYSKVVAEDAKHAFLDGAGVTFVPTTEKAEVAKATAATASMAGSATEGILQVTVHSAAWNTSIETIMKNVGNSSTADPVKIASVTVKVSANSIT